MGVIAIRVSNEIEKQIKEKAQTEGKSLSAYCKEVILEGHQEQEQPLSRATIESEIDELKRSIDRLNSNMIILSKKTLRESHMNSNLVLGFFNAVIEDDETKQTIYNRAVEDTEEFLSKNFSR